MRKIAMYSDYIDDIKYCVKDFDIAPENYNVFKPSELGIKGDDSNLIYIKESTSIPSFLIISIAENVKDSKIFLGKNLIEKKKSYIYLKHSNEFFYMGDNSGIGDLRVFMSGEETFIVIGAGVEVIQHNSKWILGSNPGKKGIGIIVGDHCLIGGENIIRSSDGHPVIDLITNKQVNISHTPIIIEPYCWLGQRVTILKNTRIGACSIAAMGSIVTKQCDKFSSLMGTPAIAKNIYGKLWRRSNSKEVKDIFEIYKKRFILGNKDDNN
jgi:acetyltransferase-like isoleucine patch superfamily enzyme